MIELKAEPDIQLARFSIWVHEQCEGWLNVTIRCVGNIGQGQVSGSLMRFMDLEVWLKGLQYMNRTMAGEANFSTTDPGAHVSMRINKLGQIATEVEISCVDGRNDERYIVEFQVDQSYLPQLIAQCEQVLQMAEFS